MVVVLSVKFIGLIGFVNIFLFSQFFFDRFDFVDEKQNFVILLNSGRLYLREFNQDTFMVLSLNFASTFAVK